MVGSSKGNLVIQELHRSQAFVPASTIIETDPGVRGDTAQGGVKPANLETGAVIRVPLFVEQGEVVKVDTRTGEYVSRAKE